MKNTVSIVSLCRIQMSDIFEPTVCGIIYKYDYVHGKEKFKVKVDWTKNSENTPIRIIFEI